MAFYEDFAKVYDKIMDQGLYEQWLSFSLRHFPANTHKILELACGSGELSVRFDKTGLEVTGLDIAEGMLTLAKNKLPQRDFILGDMRELADLVLAGQFDAVTCYSDSLCYLSDLTEVKRVAEAVHGSLKPGGVFLFDVHSLYQVTTVFPGYSYHENAEDYAFLWDSFAGAAPNSVEHELTFFVKNADGSFIRKDELHHERTYAIFEYLAVLSNFSRVNVYADFNDEAPTDDSSRWFFVCRKD